MHESRLVSDLVSKAESEASGSPRKIKRLTFRIGALCGVPADSLRHGVQEQAVARWGHLPAITIDESTDPIDPNALGIVLVSIQMAS
ncbi:MAG: hydrogenase maturation nickel metallochaperone HypA [bacterium]|nr:hydrogenase maturation nickel metallochaperone HypA [bacterium]